MNKRELIGKIAEDAGISKAVTARAVDSFIRNIKDSLKRGEKITLIGLGTFSIVERKTRSGRNPKTGEAITIPAKKMPKFIPGSGLKRAIK